MKKYEKYNVEATDENIKKAIMNNTYDRAKSIKGFIEGLDLLDTSAIISLDARWGEGKTFYIRQAEMSLHYLSKRILNQDVSDLEEAFQKSILKNISLTNTFLPIYFNSWLYDYNNDPLMALLYVLVKECGKYVSTTMNTNSIGDKLLSLLSPFSLAFPSVQVSGDLERIKEKLTGKDLLEEIKTAEQIRLAGIK